ncbi:MAG: hypothetical protein R2788_17210 [Saprospiraceae bacterium]
MRKLFAIVSLFVFMGTAMAQKTIKEMADMPDKKFSKLMTEENYAKVRLELFAKAYEKQTGKDLPEPVPVI